MVTHEGAVLSKVFLKITTDETKISVLLVKTFRAHLDQQNESH